MNESDRTVSHVSIHAQDLLNWHSQTPILGAMSPVLKHRRVLIWLLCVAIVVMRVGAVHIHFCQDGTEPPVSLHVADSGIDDRDHPSQNGTFHGHTDSSVSVPGNALLKGSIADVDTPALTITLGLLLFLMPLFRPVRANWNIPVVRIPTRSWYLPPLRGPPV